MLELVAVSKSYRVDTGWWPKRRKAGGAGDPRAAGRWFHAVSDVSLRASRGEVLGLIGPNGAGKTTLLRVLATALAPSSGTVVVDGLDATREPGEARRRLGFLSGDTGLYERLTPREMLRYFGRLHGLEGAALEARLQTLGRQLELGTLWDRRCGTLSTGQKQRVSIARALVHEPSVVILDEPTTGLDVMAAESMLTLVESLRAQQRTVILSTHHMHEVARLCDRVVLVHQGRVGFDGSVVSLAERGDGSLERAFLKLVGAVDPGVAHA